MRERICDKQGIADLINHTGLSHINMIEIGSYAGESSELFLKTQHVRHITCIDPWMTIVEKDGGNSYFNMDRVEAEFDARMSAYDGMFTKFKGTIDSYVSLSANSGSAIDLVYIDALHTYAGCMNDIRKTLEHIKPRFISGHDYADSPAHIVGVKLAVNEVFGMPDAVFCDTSWIKKLS